MRYIVCAGMYRAGSTWQYDVVSHLAEKHQGGVRLGFMEGFRFTTSQSRDTSQSPVSVLKTHDAHDEFAAALAGHRAVGVYAYRDIRDVVFSWMHKARLEFAELITQGFVQKLVANDAFWRSQPGIYTQRYETLIQKPVQSTQELAKHLSITLAPGEAEAIAETYSRSANLKRTEDLRRKATEEGVDLESASQSFLQDPTTLLHWNHLREGDRKGWRDIATPGQLETLGIYCSDWLIDNGYETDRSWSRPHAEPEKPQGGIRGWFERVLPKFRAG